MTDPNVTRRGPLLVIGEGFPSEVYLTSSDAAMTPEEAVELAAGLRKWAALMERWAEALVTEAAI